MNRKQRRSAAKATIRSGQTSTATAAADPQAALNEAKRLHEAGWFADAASLYGWLAEDKHAGG